LLPASIGYPLPQVSLRRAPLAVDLIDLGFGPSQRLSQRQADESLVEGNIPRSATSGNEFSAIATKIGIW
jgi:hypothetical protein